MKTKIKIKKIVITKINLILLSFIFLIDANIYLFKKVNNKFQPKISIFLPIYNKAKFLKRSIGSLQIQTLKDIEIIPVNDCSEDDTLEILKKMAKNDSRIKIINNERNRGLLYSRAMGILKSKGEYIMNLDPDDELSNPYNLEYLYKIINKLKVDIISFGLIIKKYGSFPTQLFLCSNNKKIQYQPEIFTSNSENFDFLITNKLIKKELFKKVYFLFKEKIYKEKWNYAEDEIWSILVNKNAKSRFCLESAIYIYHINSYCLIKNNNNILYIENIINWIEMLKKILFYKNEKIYLNRFNIFIRIIKRNKNFITTLRNDREIRSKYLHIFRNISFKNNTNL